MKDSAESLNPERVSERELFFSRGEFLLVALYHEKGRIYVFALTNCLG